MVRNLVPLNVNKYVGIGVSAGGMVKIRSLGLEFLSASVGKVLNGTDIA